MSTTLQDLVNRAVFFSTEMQTHFGALIADAEWEVDFTSNPHLTFSSSDGAVLRGRPHLLGSESKSQSTWLWGWENINEFPETVVGLSHDVRKFGAAEDVAELITPELALDEELALRLTLAAKEATGKWAHYPAAAGAGTTVWLLVDAPELTLPDPQVKTTVRALMQGLTQTTVTDHRAALEAYVDKRGIPTAQLAEGGLRLLFADGSADLSFDEQRRISNCEMGAPLEGEAAEQYAQATGAAGLATGSSGAAAGAETSEPVAQSDKSATRSAAEAATAAQPTANEQVGGSADSASADRATAPSPTGSTTEAPDSSTPTASSAEAATTNDGASGSARPTSSAEPLPGTGTQPPPVGEQAPASPAADETQDGDRTTDEEEAKPEEPKKKKGLFSKLFGR